MRFLFLGIGLGKWVPGARSRDEGEKIQSAGVRPERPWGAGEAQPQKCVGRSDEEAEPGTELGKRPQKEPSREDPPEESQDSTGEGPWVRGAVGSGSTLFIDSVKGTYCPILILTIKSIFVWADWSGPCHHFSLDKASTGLTVPSSCSTSTPCAAVATAVWPLPLGEWTSHPSQPAADVPQREGQRPIRAFWVTHRLIIRRVYS